MVVTLLGTGTPALDPTRFSQSTLVSARGLDLVTQDGPLTVGADLMRFEIGGEVEVVPPPAVQ